MSKEVDIWEATGEPTNASAARGPTPTLVVRRPDDGSRPEIPAMTLRSHLRGGRSSACAQEPSSQAGSYPTSKENLGVHSTRQEKSGPEPEIHPTTPMTQPILPQWVRVSICNRRKITLPTPNHHKFIPDPENQLTLV